MSRPIHAHAIFITCWFHHDRCSHFAQFTLKTKVPSRPKAPSKPKVPNVFVVLPYNSTTMSSNLFGIFPSNPKSLVKCGHKAHDWRQPCHRRGQLHIDVVECGSLEVDNEQRVVATMPIRSAKQCTCNLKINPETASNHGSSGSGAGWGPLHRLTLMEQGRSQMTKARNTQRYGKKPRIPHFAV